MPKTPQSSFSMQKEKRSKKLHWQMTLTGYAYRRLQERCLIRIGKAIHLKNREDIDIMKRQMIRIFLHTNLQQIWLQWFFQVGFIILSDSHRFLADTTGRCFFALWRQMTSQIFQKKQQIFNSVFVFRLYNESTQKK